MKTLATVGGIAVLLALGWLAPTSARAAEAEMNYQTYCWQCHGMAGTGNGVNVRDMPVNPRDHTNRVTMSGLSDQRIFKAIKHGGASVASSPLMPAWNSVLTDAEIHELVSYLRTLCNCKGTG